MDSTQLQATLMKTETLKKLKAFLNANSPADIIEMLSRKIPEAVDNYLEGKSESEKNEVLADMQTFLQKMSEGAPLYSAMGMQIHALEKLYSEAYLFYEAGLYLKALNYFQLLVNFNATESRYVLALAAAQQRLKRYDDAIESYLSLAEMAPRLPLPFFYLYECYLQKGELGTARQALISLLKRADASPLYEGQADKARLMLRAHVERFGED